MQINALLQESSFRIAKNGKPFFQLVFTSKETTLKGYYWKDKSNEEFLNVGKVYKVDYEPGEFPTIVNITQLDLSPYDFIPSYFSSEIDAAKLLSTMVKSVEDPDLSKLLSMIFSENATKFIHAPAAKGQHHAKDGGLLQHSYEVFSNALALSTSETFKGFQLDLDVIKTASVLHDIGKLWEYETSFGSIDYGRSIYESSHLSSGAEFVSKFFKEIPPKVAHVQHIIRSHHGPQSLNWGSIVSPATIEAYIVFVSDYMSMHADKFKEVSFGDSGVGTSQQFRDVYLKF